MCKVAFKAMALLSRQPAPCGRATLFTVATHFLATVVTRTRLVPLLAWYTVVNWINPIGCAGWAP
jgi:hypothetical protein